MHYSTDSIANNANSLRITVLALFKPRGSIFQNGFLTSDCQIKNAQKLHFSMISWVLFKSGVQIKPIRYLAAWIQLQSYLNTATTIIAILSRATTISLRPLILYKDTGSVEFAKS